MRRALSKKIDRTRLKLKIGDAIMDLKTVIGEVQDLEGQKALLEFEKKHNYDPNRPNMSRDSFAFNCLPAVKTNEPVSQGFVSLMEPFLDTVIICSLTAFVIIITGEYLNYREGITGVQLTSAAFGGTFSFFPYVLAVVIILFAISTIISWAYYGQKAWSYLFGEGFWISFFHRSVPFAGSWLKSRTPCVRIVLKGCVCTEYILSW